MFPFRRDRGETRTYHYPTEHYVVSKNGRIRQHQAAIDVAQLDYVVRQALAAMFLELSRQFGAQEAPEPSYAYDEAVVFTPVDESLFDDGDDIAGLQ